MYVSYIRKTCRLNSLKGSCALLLRVELIRHGGMVSENNLSKSRTAVKIAVNSKPSADA